MFPTNIDYVANIHRQLNGEYNQYLTAMNVGDVSALVVGDASVTTMYRAARRVKESEGMDFIITKRLVVTDEVSPPIKILLIIRIR